MENHVNIQEELLEVAPSLAAISQQMPNGLPEGYFDILALEMLRKTSAPLQNLTIPDGYFETLPLEILLKANGPQQTGQVPEGYFESFADKMLARIKEQEITQEEEEEEISPLLKSIGKKTPFSVPDGYFEQLTIPTPAIPIGSNHAEETAPVISIRTKRNNWMWAVAACSIGIISLLTWKFAGRTPVDAPVNPISRVTIDPSVSDTSEATIELAAALAGLEDNSLQTAISQIGATEADTHSAVFYLNTDNFENAVKDLSDEELEQYLSESIGVSKKS